LPTGPIPPDPELLDRYLAGECSDLERHTIETWLREHPDEAVRVGIVAYAARYPLGGTRERKAAAYDAFLARIRAGDAADRKIVRPHHTGSHPVFGDRYTGAGHRGGSPSWRSSTRRLLAAAAVFAMVGAGTWAIVRGRMVTTLGDQAPAVWKTFSAAHGQRAVIDLADGTRVTLAPESELRVRQPSASRPKETLREVALSGEGYFEVAHVASRPFLIHTPHGTVTQLGTSFDVRAYEGDRGTRVAVTDGRVSLTPTPTRAAPPDAVVLAAGDFAMMTNVGVTDVARGIAVGQYTAWMQGELRFANAPLRSVIAELERWYDVKIVLEDSSFAAYRLTASLRHGSVDDVMDVVVKSLDLRAKRKGDTVWIVGKNAQPTKGS
jgi:ferric-dicitrate binding protein FerR (iron transport regulator)